MANFNVIVDETNNQVIVNEYAQSIIIRSLGTVGPKGDNGNDGADGVGVPVGGTTGQVLAKNSNADYDTEWVDQTGGGGGGVTDHGALTGLSDDDHPQYHNDSRGDARYYTKTLSDAAYEPKNANIQSHISSTSNPHGVTKSQVGLGSVDNTSDLDKPVSTATQTALDGKVDENAPITGATKTKITYDAKGLVTGGTDATTADIADSSNKRYVTDAQLAVIGNTSGTNTGDQDLSGYELLSNKDNGSLAASSTLYPTSGAVKSAVDAKADIAGDTFTGAVIPSVVALTDAATIAVNAALGNQFTVTLGGNRTLGNPTGAVNGQLLLFALRQDGAGSRTITLDTKFRFGADITSITLSTGANKTDYIGVRYHSSDDTFDVISFVGGY